MGALSLTQLTSHFLKEVERSEIRRGGFLFTIHVSRSTALPFLFTIHDSRFTALLVLINLTNL